jgi:hypothetical protein
MLDSTDGLPGPVIMKRLGKPADPIPRYVRGPALHVSLSDNASRPRMSTVVSDPVMASKPVA